MVVAFLDQSRCATYRRVEEAPAGAAVFSSADELARVLSLEALDRMRCHLLGKQLPRSESRIEVARKVWYLLTIDIPPINVPRKLEPRKDSFGNRKHLDRSPVELIELIWYPGCPGMADAYVKKFVGTKKLLFDFLVEDGRSIWTEGDAVKVVLANEHRLDTVQGGFGVWSHYRSEFFHKQVLQRLTFAEFSKRLHDVRTE